MEILFKREQSPGKLTRVNFKLWGKIELDEDEQAIVERYRFDNAVLIEAIQPGLLRKAIIISLLAGVFAAVILQNMGPGGLVLALIIGSGIGYFYFHNKRETIFVRDLLHGRNFKCDSVVELARKEAWLQTIVSFLRQVMESAKHWDGTERHSVEALPKEEARQVIIKGI